MLCSRYLKLYLQLERKLSDLIQKIVPPFASPNRPNLRAPAPVNAPFSWLGMLEAALSLSGYLFVLWLAGWHLGLPLESSNSIYPTATTMTLAGIVACQVGNAFACRSESDSIWRLGFTTNRMLIGGIVIEVCLLLILIYVLPLRSLFGLAPLAPIHWLLLLTFGPLLLLFEECRKALRRAWQLNRRTA